LLSLFRSPNFHLETPLRLSTSQRETTHIGRPALRRFRPLQSHDLDTALVLSARHHMSPSIARNNGQDAVTSHQDQLLDFFSAQGTHIYLVTYESRITAHGAEKQDAAKCCLVIDTLPLKRGRCPRYPAAPSAIHIYMARFARHYRLHKSARQTPRQAESPPFAGPFAKMQSSEC